MSATGEQLEHNPPEPLNLPQEIVDLIVDIHEFDIKTLKSCALISHSFRIRCQQHIYRNITLGPAKGPHLVTQLRKIFTQNPSLTRLVHTLNIVEFSLGGRAGGYYPSKRSWMYISADLRAILPLMKHTRKIALECQGAILSWRDFGAELQNSLRAVMLGGHVECLVLEGINGFPCSLISSVTTLKELELLESHLHFDLDVYKNWDSGANANSKWSLKSDPSRRLGTGVNIDAAMGCQLKSLSVVGRRINDMYNINPFSVFNSPFPASVDISHLEKLTIRPEYTADGLSHFSFDCLCLPELFEIVSANLKELWLEPTFQPRQITSNEQLIERLISSIGKKCTFSPLPQLSTLHITFKTTNNYTTRGKLSYAWCHTLLTNIQSKNWHMPSLETINIICGFPEQNPTQSFNAAFWSTLDGVLDSPAFGNLRRVNIVYMFYRYHSKEHEEMGGLIKEEMTGLMGRGVLRVGFRRGNVDDRKVWPSQAPEIVGV